MKIFSSGKLHNVCFNKLKKNNLLELSTGAYKLIFRMCESYELWCKETNQSQLIQLDVLD